jgi:hypothetical protein
VKLAVLGSDAANVFVEGTGAIHYAVGAGSCVLVETNSGFYLFDAGINLHEGHALAQRIPDLRIPTGPTSVTSTTGEVMHVSRELHGIMRLDALYQDDVLLVGVAGSGKVAGMVNIVALNDAAVEVLGTTATTAVHESRLMAATEDDLAR